jgi:ATP-dependent Clp protease ATP-binding subunit ClpC
MFERFTEKAIKSIMIAQDEGRRCSHAYVGTEQLLLGLMSEGTGIAARALEDKQLTLAILRKECEKLKPNGNQPVGRDQEIPFTDRAKLALEGSWDAARGLGHNYIGTEHLLLGILRENTGTAVQALRNLNVDLDELEEEVIVKVRAAIKARKEEP